MPNRPCTTRRDRLVSGISRHSASLEVLPYYPTSIDYDAATRTYDLRLGGEFIGIAHTEAEAQAALSGRVTPAYLASVRPASPSFARLHTPAQMEPAEYLARLERDLGLTD